MMNGAEKIAQVDHVIMHDNPKISMITMFFNFIFQIIFATINVG